MLEEEQNVEQEAIQPEQENVVEETIQPQETVEAETEITDTPSAEVTAVSSEVDEFGVPYKNRYMEMRRKNEGINTEISELKEMVKGLQATQQKPKYSKEQLMEFIARDETEPGQRTWALTELDKLEEAKVSEKIEQKFNALQTQQKSERDRAETFNFIVQRHPELILKDAAGRMVGWNTKNPLVQRMNGYMTNLEIANNPFGLRVALALAKDDLSGTTKATTQKLKTQVKTLQKGTLVEGGGKNTPISKSSLRKAVEEAKKGDMKSGTSAMSEILRAQGLIK